MATEMYELTVEGVHNQQYVENVMHFQGDNLAANDTWTNGRDVVSSFITNVLPQYLALLPPTYQCTRITGRRAITKPSIVAHTQFAMASKPGTLGTEASAYNVCPCIFILPLMGVKSGGKIFLPCVPEGQIIANVYQSTYITAYNAFVAAILSNFGTSSITWQLAVYSRKNHTFSLAAGTRLSSVIGYQGRRRKAVGA